MNRFRQMTQMVDAEIEERASAYAKNFFVYERQPSRLPKEAGLFAMQNRDHPDAPTWADVSPGKEWEEHCVYVAKEFPPYPQERGGKNTDERTIVHPVWPPKAQASLSPRVEQAARDFDRIIRDYNTPRIA